MLPISKSALRDPSFSDVIVVYAGVDKVPLPLEMDYVRITSGFIEAERKKGWPNVDERSISLPGIKPDTFRLYKRWAYAE